MVEFADRRDAGARLALRLQGYAERPDVVVVALRRGGIQVGYELATRLNVQLLVLDANKQLWPDRLAQDVRDRTTIVSVDGVEHASSVLPFLAELRRCCPAAIVAAIPVAYDDAYAELEHHVDHMICLVKSRREVESSYADFSRVSDREMHRLLEQARREWQAFVRHGSRWGGVMNHWLANFWTSRRSRRHVESVHALQHGHT